jgi:hypothetical protein
MQPPSHDYTPEMYFVSDHAAGQRILHAWLHHPSKTAPPLQALDSSAPHTAWITFGNKNPEALRRLHAAIKHHVRGPNSSTWGTGWISRRATGRPLSGPQWSSVRCHSLTQLLAHHEMRWFGRVLLCTFPLQVPGCNHTITAHHTPPYTVPSTLQGCFRGGRPGAWTGHCMTAVLQREYWVPAT